MTPYRVKEDREVRFSSITYGIIWIVGVLGILFVFSRHLRQIFKLDVVTHKQRQEQESLTQSQHDTIKTKTVMIKAQFRFIPEKLSTILYQRDSAFMVLKEPFHPTGYGEYSGS